MGDRHRHRKFDPEEGLTCHYCNIELTRRNHSIDHVVPTSLGGRDEKFNRVHSCVPCNATKQNKWPECNCRFCRKSVRIHREAYKIKPPKP